MRHTPSMLWWKGVGVGRWEGGEVTSQSFPGFETLICKNFQRFPLLTRDQRDREESIVQSSCKHKTPLKWYCGKY